MPQVDLSTASGRELRQLLDSSRSRGDAAQTYKILQEMAARRDGGGRVKRRAGEPRVIDLDLGDPLDRDEDDIPPMPRWRPPSGEPATDMPPPALRIVEDAPIPDEALEHLDLRLGPADLERFTAPRAPRSRGRAGAILGAALLLALGGGAGWFARDVLSPAAAPAIESLQVAAVTPAPPLQPAAPAAPEPAPEPLPDVLPLEVAAEPEVPPADVAAVAEAPPEPAEPPHVAEAEAGACASAPTPADREICGDPQLRRLQAELREAYAKALAAHEERDLLRQRQLAWREARNDITEPGRLAALYEQRIRRLNAATAEARRAP
ncbi:MAG: hypothetical protein ABW360_03845 [Phenylobacterium sp.]